MRLRATQLSSNAHGPLRSVAALVAAMFAATTAPAFDWTASDLSTQYQDSAGTLPVTAVEQPVGLVLDRSKGGAQRGPELVQNGGFDGSFNGWTIPVTAPGTAVVSGGRATLDSGASGTSRLRQNFAITPGWYEMIFEVVTYSGPSTNLQISLGSDTSGGSQYLAMSGIGLTPGVQRRVFYADSTLLGIAFFLSSVTQQATLTFDNFSIKALTGTNAWNNAPTVIDANWTNAGGGVFTSNGGTGTLGIANRLVIGRTYEAVIRVTARSAGTLNLPYDGTGGNVSSVNAVGLYRRIFTATATAVFIYSNAFNGTADVIQVREIPGSHLIQPTSASRPTLTARVNLLTYSEQISHANWTKTAGGTGTTPIVTDNFGVAPDGTTTAARLQMSINGGTTSADISRITQLVTGMPVGGTYTQGVWLKTNDGSTRVVQFRDDNAGTVGKNITVTGAWQYFSQDSTVSAGLTTVNAVGLWVRGTLGTADSVDLLMWHPQFNYGPPARYQRIGAATDYDSVGFAKGWRFDGVDDSLYSPASFNWASTKVSITAAIRKLSDAATAMVLEFGPTSTSDGTFYLAAPLNAGVANVGTGSRGTSAAFVAVTGVPAPAGLILSMTGDIAAPSVALRVNGVPSNASSTTQGAGSYGNYVMNVGRRNNASNPFNGLIHSLRGNGRVQSPDEQGWLEALGKLDMNNNL